MSKQNAGEDDDGNDIVFDSDAFAAVSSWMTSTGDSENDDDNDIQYKSKKPLYQQQQVIKVRFAFVVFLKCHAIHSLFILIC